MYNSNFVDHTFVENHFLPRKNVNLYYMYKLNLCILLIIKKKSIIFFRFFMKFQ